MINDDVFFDAIVIIGNVLSVIYNVPQMYHTWKVKRAGDISAAFLWMRLASAVLWTIYCIRYSMWEVLISWSMSLVSTVQIMYYKYRPSDTQHIELA